jgi:hypothetical protein
VCCEWAHPLRCRGQELELWPVVLMVLLLQPSWVQVQRWRRQPMVLLALLVLPLALCWQHAHRCSKAVVWGGSRPLRACHQAAGSSM